MICHKTNILINKFIISVKTFLESSEMVSYHIFSIRLTDGWILTPYQTINPLKVISCLKVRELCTLYVYIYIFVLLYLKSFFVTLSYQIWIIPKSIWSIGETPTSTTTSGQSGPRSNGKEDVIYCPQISRTGALTSDPILPRKSSFWVGV